MLYSSSHLIVLFHLLKFALCFNLDFLTLQTWYSGRIFQKCIIREFLTQYFIQMNSVKAVVDGHE